MGVGPPYGHASIPTIGTERQSVDRLPGIIRRSVGLSMTMLLQPCLPLGFERLKGDGMRLTVFQAILHSLQRPRQILRMPHKGLGQDTVGRLFTEEATGHIAPEEARCPKPRVMPGSELSGLDH